MSKRMKKGFVVQAGSAIVWLIFLSVQLSSVVFMTNMFLKVSMDIRGVEERIFINKAMYSPHGITLYDPDIGRVYPNVIDFTRFNSSYIQEAIYNPESFKIGIKLKLKDIQNNEIRTIFMDEESYFADSHSIVEERIVVIDYRDGRKEHGLLEVGVS